MGKFNTSISYNSKTNSKGIHYVQRWRLDEAYKEFFLIKYENIENVVLSMFYKIIVKKALTAMKVILLIPVKKFLDNKGKNLSLCLQNNILYKIYDGITSSIETIANTLVTVLMLK